MKLQELGLKSKPQTKYFEGGYVSFSTVNCVLYYKIYHVGKLYSIIMYKGMVEDKQHFERLMSFKNFNEVTQEFIQA